MRTWFILAALMLFSATAHARMYQCVKNGSTIYQDTPCPQDSTSSKEFKSAIDGLRGFPWLMLRSGMSVDEVKAIIPDIEPGTQGRDDQGAEALLILKGLSVAGCNFEANFFFKQGRYQGVRLYTHTFDSFEENSRKFDLILTKLNSVFGVSKDHRRANQIVVPYGYALESASWRLENGYIMLRINPGNTGPTQSVSSLVLSFVPDNTAARSR